MYKQYIIESIKESNFDKIIFNRCWSFSYFIIKYIINKETFDWSMSFNMIIGLNAVWLYEEKLSSEINQTLRNQILVIYLIIIIF